jgi:putative intracellular protease/amidase
LEEAGYEVKLVGPKEKEKYCSKEGYWAFSDTTFGTIDASQVKCLIIPGHCLFFLSFFFPPAFFFFLLFFSSFLLFFFSQLGGLLCPDRLRRYKECLQLVSEVKRHGGVIGFICHGACMLLLPTEIEREDFLIL